MSQLALFIRSKSTTDADSDPVFIQRFLPYDTIDAFKLKTVDEISSSGYVLDTLEAALWAFFTTPSFEEGAITTVNLGDDADTVGAVYGGLAGAFYGEEQIPRRWLDKLVGSEKLKDVLNRILHSRGLQ